MCIAIIKNKNIDIPSDDILRICFKNNPDGAGFVLNRNGMNYIYKGFFTFDGFLKALKSVSPLKEESLMIHFRVATHGKINIENCHPFPIDGTFKNMLKPIYATENDVMVHNGKLSIDITNSIYSDSMHFARTLYRFDRKENSDFLEYIIQPTEKNKKGNRVGIIKSNGETEYYGVGWIVKDGILYSNDSFKTNGTYQSSFKKKKSNCGFLQINNALENLENKINQSNNKNKEIYLCYRCNKKFFASEVFSDNGKYICKKCNNIQNIFSPPKEQKYLL